MKKAGMMLVAGLLVTGALAQDVTSVNVVGFNKVAIGPGQYAFLALPFESFGDATLEDLVGDQLPQNSAAYIWDRVSKTFVPSSRTKFGWSGTNVIHRGDGFWLRNASTTTTNYVSLMGEVPAAYNNSATTTVAGISGVDAVGYAYPTDVTWTNTTLSQQVPQNAALYVWDEVTQQLVAFSKTKFGWSTPPGYSIKAGRAFWISTTTPVDWSEVAPYNL